ncbi:hypothetical protein AX15_001935, partial [Amanita polypyramis BW_CC]
MMDLSSMGQVTYMYSFLERKPTATRTFILDRREVQSELRDDSARIGRPDPTHNTYKTATAHCQKLPDDVLRDIFKLYRGDAPLCVPIKSWKDLAIIHVCSSWRQLALDMPEMWVNVSVVLDPGIGGERALRVAHELLSHARGMPRSLELRMFRPSRHDVASRLIAPFRYRKLHLQIHYSEWLCILNIPNDALASVERLELYPFDNCGSRDP